MLVVSWKGLVDGDVIVGERIRADGSRRRGERVRSRFLGEAHLFGKLMNIDSQKLANDRLQPGCWRPAERRSAR